MSLQKVDTEQIAAAAGAITTANGNMNTNFEKIRTLGQSMSGSWNSAAAEAAENLMQQLFKGNEAREAMFQNCANLLSQQVNPGYENSETANTKLADMFL